MPNAFPKHTALWTRSPHPVILALLTAVILSHELQSLKSCARTIWRGHVTNNGHTHVQLISLPLSLCSTGSAGLFCLCQGRAPGSGTIIKVISVLGVAFVRYWEAWETWPQKLTCCWAKAVCVCRMKSHRSLCLLSVKSGISERFVQQVQLKIQWKWAILSDSSSHHSDIPQATQPVRGIAEWVTWLLKCMLHQTRFGLNCWQMRTCLFQIT